MGEPPRADALADPRNLAVAFKSPLRQQGVGFVRGVIGMDARPARLHFSLMILSLICTWFVAPVHGEGPAKPLAAAARPAGAIAAPASDAKEPSRNAQLEDHALRPGSGGRVIAGRNESGDSARTGGWWMWLQTLGILGIVLAVMVLVLKWLRRAGLGGLSGGSTAAVQILSRGYLTNKHQMVLVRFGGRILLLGVGPQNLDVLSEVKDPAEGAQILAQLEGGKAGSISRDFRQTIDAAVRQYDRDGKLEPPVEEPVRPGGAGDVGALRQELGSLVARMQSMARRVLRDA
jgi:flagellar biogenesis protein FliO